MKKDGIVLKIEGKYLDVWMIENAPCSSPVSENGVLPSDEEKLHDCTCCSGCSSILGKDFKAIKVLNKSGKDVKVGQKITYSFDFLPLQFFIIVLLPILAFGFTFFLFYLYLE